MPFAGKHICRSDVVERLVVPVAVVELDELPELPERVHIRTGPGHHVVPSTPRAGDALYCALWGLLSAELTDFTRLPVGIRRPTRCRLQFARRGGIGVIPVERSLSAMVNSPASATAPVVPDFEDLHETYRDRVYRVILRIVGDASDADDLTQETFLKVERSAAHVRHPEKVASWLYRVATNVALDHLRRSRRKDSSDALDPGSEHGGTLLDVETPSPASSLDTAESVSCVREYADRLPDQYRVIVILHDLEGLPMQQVADAMGSSVGATRVRLHRARKRFAEICQVECEQFYNEDGVLSCQPKSLISVQVAPSPCCESGSSDCCPA